MSDARPIDRPQGERIVLIDALRGVALLGILWINMTGHALPFFAMWDPRLAGGNDALNMGAWAASEIFVEGAMRGLFSLLFGVSVLLYLREDGRGALFARRNLWLMAFGLVHGFLLLMPGDILFTYGICAFLLYPLHRAPARALAVFAAVSIVVLAGGELMIAANNAAIRDAALANGASEAVKAAYQDLLWPTAEAVADLNERASIGYPALLPYMAGDYGWFLLSPAFPAQILDAPAMMIAGHGAFDFNPLYCAAFVDHFVDNMNPPAEALSGIARASLTLGYAFVFCALWRLGKLGFAARPLSALGRTAFTHYIGGTLIATTLFYGHGLGLYGKLDRIGVYGVIILVWILQAAFSLWWLKRYSIGPLEWVWRSLTQWRLQKLRVDWRERSG